MCVGIDIKVYFLLILFAFHKKFVYEMHILSQFEEGLKLLGL